MQISLGVQGLATARGCGDSSGVPGVAAAKAAREEGCRGMLLPCVPVVACLVVVEQCKSSLHRPS